MKSIREVLAIAGGLALLAVGPAISAQEQTTQEPIAESLPAQQTATQASPNTASPHTAAPNTAGRDAGKAYRDVRTMALVLTESLQRADFINDGPHVAGASPFDDRIDSTYIPTVGVVFNVPVRFPIVEPREPAPEPAEPKFNPDEDLWERFRSRNDSRDTARERMSDAGREEVRVRVEGQQDEQVIERREIERRDRPEPALDRPGRLDPWGNPYTFMVGVDREPYDAAKVEALRNVVIETLAKYGHRMDDVPADERILVVIDAPRSPRSHQRKPEGGDAKFDQGFNPITGGRDWTSGFFGTESMRVLSPGEMMNGYTFLPEFAASRYFRDRWLISLPKSELSEGVSAETIASKIQEVRY